MYNPEKPKFRDVVNLVMVVVLIIALLIQNNQISQLTTRMNRIESEEKDFTVWGQVQDLLEEINSLLVEHDKLLVTIYEQQVEDGTKISGQESTINSLLEENRDLIEQMGSLYKLLFEHTNNSTMTLKPATVESRKANFRIGDCIGWVIESDYPLDGATIKIWFPNGTLAWETDEMTNWIYAEGNWVLPFYSQTANTVPILLLDEYPLGNYTYAFRYRGFYEVTGGFTVIEAAVDVISDM